MNQKPSRSRVNDVVDRLVEVVDGPRYPDPYETSLAGVGTRHPFGDMRVSVPFVGLGILGSRSTSVKNGRKR
ncbi:Hypothetical protein NGAL_HAMBI1146_00070 [Neorhizobium galegae bv. officinalis]|nr:Hypothetical protein NGAL_HAMBI1146_00070 [Neorhizobium galegae bv. officinalis]